MTCAPPVLHYRGVQKTYVADTEIRAIENVSLEVASGEIVAIVGPSGCGKTTLLRLAAGLLRPSSGEVTIHGVAPQEYAKERAIGYVPQSPALLPWRTAFANASLPFELGRERRAMDAERVLQFFDLLRIKEYRDLFPRELSGGIAQRVSVARALSCDAKVVLMDEPFSALDAPTREQLWSDGRHVFRAAHTAAVLVTHNIDEAVSMADRVVVLSSRPGHIVGEVLVATPDSSRIAPSIHDRAAGKKTVEGIRSLLSSGAFVVRDEVI